jgi:hypothetical protein
VGIVQILAQKKNGKYQRRNMEPHLENQLNLILILIGSLFALNALKWLTGIASKNQNNRSIKLLIYEGEYKAWTLK